MYFYSSRKASTSKALADDELKQITKYQKKISDDESSADLKDVIISDHDTVSEASLDSIDGDENNNILLNNRCFLGKMDCFKWTKIAPKVTRT